MASEGTPAAGERFDDGVRDAGAGGVGGVTVGAVGDEADVDGGGVGHDDDFVGGGDGDGAVVLVDLDGLGRLEWMGSERRRRGEDGEVEESSSVFSFGVDGVEQSGEGLFVFRLGGEFLFGVGQDALGRWGADACRGRWT